MSAVESHYQPQTTFPEIKFALDRIPPPSNLYVGREDKLFITTFNSATGLTLEVHVRLLLPNGTVVPTVQAHVPNTNRTSSTTTIPLAEGFILSVLVVASVGSAKRGQCYVVVGLQRGDNANPITHQVMIQGYVGSTVNQAWPGNRLEQPTEGPGAIRAISGTVPGAGADISETVPTGARWKLRSLQLTLTTSVAVANRQPSLFISPSGVGVFSIAPAAYQTASLAIVYVYGAALAATVSANGLIKTLPVPMDINLAAGNVFGTSTLSMQAADQYGAPLYEVEEWIEP